MSQQQRKRTKNVVVNKSKHDELKKIIEAHCSPDDDDDEVDSESAAVVVAAVQDDEDIRKCSASLIEEKEEDLQISSQTTTIKTRMLIHYGKEVLCLLAVLLTTLASYQG